MRRGEIHWVDLDPARAWESNKLRPAVVVSNDAANAATTRLGKGTVTVVPLTSNTRRVLRFHVEVPADASGLPRDSKAQAEQVRAVSVRRISGRVGVLPQDYLARLDEALRLHLGL